ncbi:beta-propeller domain-containing protein [Nocardioides sp.]|uniref:beta-propeller domain-containing protein n=1 Tax=Nocardioides sp. TaxID=35761 RepID=UPI003513AF1E
MTELEQHWDDLPVGPAPTDAIRARGRALAGTTADPTDLLARRRTAAPLRRAGVLGLVAASFVAGLMVARPGDDASGGGPGAAAPAPGPGALTPVAFTGALRAPASCEALRESYVERALPLVGPGGWRTREYPQYGYDLRDGLVLDRFTSELASLDTGTRAAMDAPKTSTAVSEPTGTNVQEAGVDEPDAVKTDGRLLLRLREDVLTVDDVSGDRVVRRATLDLGPMPGGEILLSGSTVTAFASASDAQRTRVLTIDVARPSAPRIVRTSVYDAGLQAARLHDGVVRLVLDSGLPDLDFRRGSSTEDARQVVRDTTVTDWLPTVTIDGGEPEPAVDCRDVALPRADLTLGTTTVVGFEAADDPRSGGSFGVAGRTPLSYASPDHLYLAASPTGWSDPCFACDVVYSPGGSDPGTTYLYGFDLEGTGARYLGAGSVEGTLRDRWSMDESDGVLRLALGPSVETRDENAIVTLAPQGRALVETSRLGGLGTGEEIRSVRWFDGLALLVTYRQIDPLYAVDLTGKRPTLLGTLKIPGFSSYLHPLGEQRVVGLGEGPQTTDDGRRVWGGQAGLFDVTNLTDPRRIDVVSYGRGSTTRAGQDPRQVTWLPQRRQLLTVVERGRTGYVSILSLGQGEMADTMVAAEIGPDVADVRTVPLPDGRVVLVTGDDAEFLDLPDPVEQ